MPWCFSFLLFFNFFCFWSDDIWFSFSNAIYFSASLVFTQKQRHISTQQMLSFIQHPSLSVVFCVILDSIVEFYDYDNVSCVDEVIWKIRFKKDKLVGRYSYISWRLIHSELFWVNNIDLSSFQSNYSTWIQKYNFCDILNIVFSQKYIISLQNWNYFRWRLSTDKSNKQ